MPAGSGEVVYRAATTQDQDAIAVLHAESWRRHYRGAYADSFLDGDVVGDRGRVWAERLAADPAGTLTIVAESGGGVAGFAHVMLDDHPVWGALLDNLHVADELRRRGIGRGLMALVARGLQEARPESGLHLWVLEQNRPAQAFYESLGGRRQDRAPVPPPGGDPSRLTGTPARLRYVWPEPRLLVQREAERRR